MKDESCLRIYGLCRFRREFVPVPVCVPDLWLLAFSC